MGGNEHEQVARREIERLRDDGAVAGRADVGLDALGLVGAHQRPAARVAEQHHTLDALLAQPAHTDCDLGEGVVEQEVRLRAAEPGVPTEEPVAALREVRREVVLGEVDVVVRRDERRRRAVAGRGVVDALARVAACTGAADDR